MKAYLLPDDPEPDNLRCVRMYLPDDPKFFAAFWGSMDYLATWLAWDRDEANTAALVADRMKEAVEISRTAWLTGSCCASPPPPYTEPPGDGRDEPTATIDDWLWFWRDIVIVIVTDLQDSVPPATVKDTINETLSSKLGDNYQPVADQLVDNIDSLSETEQNNLSDPEKWEQLRDKVLCDNAPTQPNYTTNFYDWLNWAADGIFTWLNDTASELFDALNSAFDLLDGGQQPANIAASASAADGGGAGFGWSSPACTWQHTYDLTATNFAMAAYEAPSCVGGGIAGAWANGVGWYGTPNGPCPYNQVMIEARRDSVPQFTLTGIDVTVNISGAGYNWVAIGRRINGVSGTLAIPENRPVGDSVVSWSGNVQATGIFFNSYIVSGQVQKYKSLTVHGTGYDPFD